MSKRIEDTIEVIGNLTDIRVIDDQSTVYSNKLLELTSEIESKDIKVKESNKEIFNLNIDVDKTRKVRGEFESENKNLADLKGS